MQRSRQFMTRFRPFGRPVFPFVVLSVLLSLYVVRAGAQSDPGISTAQSPVAPIPAEVASTHFTVTIGNSRSPVLHAVTGYYLLNFDIAAPTQITVTADDPHYWDRGVEVQPMRLGIRPYRDGASITFLLNGPAKLSVTRPGDFFSDSEMLFLFANQPDPSGYNAQTPGIRYYGPGVYHESIDAHSGDRIYIASGALIYGSLNLWQVHDVSVSGGGTLIYDGPQDPATDQGWMHKPNWHVIVMDNASNIHIEGITGIVRSRTWMVQMKDSRNINFRNIKIIGGSASNANQDGMDWLGGGDTLVQDSFFRAADDVFSMEGNWDGYSEEAMLTPGHLVSNITIENSVLSTSISNIVRLGWPKKIFDSQGFTLRNSDVIQMGVGSCGVPFALFALWADPAGKGEHSDIHFEDVRLDNWYSLTQMEQPNPGIHNVDFTRVSAMDGPAMVSSTLNGDLSGVPDARSDSDIPLQVLDGASEPHFASTDPNEAFTYSGKPKPGKKVKFSAADRPGVRYLWFFGDGSTGEGVAVRHAFPDDQGTLLDGSGRFRVLLSATDQAGHTTWTSQPVVVSNTVHKPTKTRALSAGLAPVAVGDTRSETGFLRVPSKGGYTVNLLTSTTASLTIDGVRVNSSKSHPQVCGSPGDAVQALRLSLVLARGDHRIEIARGPEIENAGPPNVADPSPVLLWEAPGLPWQPIPLTAFFHTAPAP